MNHWTKHLPHYLSLLGILFAGGFGIILFGFDKLLQTALAIGVAGAYVAWGVVHHFLHRDLHPIVIIEYALIALFGLSITLSIINR